MPSTLSRSSALWNGAVLLPILDDGLRLRRTDAVELLGERRGVGGVDVDRAGPARGERQQADDQAWTRARRMRLSFMLRLLGLAGVRGPGMARGDSQASGRGALRASGACAESRALTCEKGFTFLGRARPCRARQELERRDAAQRVPGMAARAVPEERRAVEAALAAPVARVAQHDVAQRAGDRAQLLARRFARRPAGTPPAMSRRSLSIVSISRTHSRITRIVVIAADDRRISDLGADCRRRCASAPRASRRTACGSPACCAASASRGSTSASRWKSRRTTR